MHWSLPTGFNREHCAGQPVTLVSAVLLIALAWPQHTTVAAEDRAVDANLRAELLAHPVSPALGGDTSLVIKGERAFRSVAPNAGGINVARFTFGQQLFDTVWEPAPGSQPTTDGLGPLFNRKACADCHIGNGRGRPPEPSDGPMDSMLVRISIPGAGKHGEPRAVPGYGDQLQDRSVAGVPAEGRVVISYVELPGEFADGTAYSLLSPRLRFADMAYGKLPADMLSSARVASPVIGLGLLESVSEATLRSLADPNDRDADGISGRVNVVWDAGQQHLAIGRFGWKANAPTLRHQNAAAALGDMGITSPVFPEDQCMPSQEACIAEAAKVADPPELVQPFFDPLLTYTRLIAVPEQRDADAEAIKSGAAAFKGIGCASCHMPTLVTGPSDVAVLANQVIHPYTDLLLHDMGDGLADGRPDFAASGHEWRTAPLWGIGLTEAVGGFTRFLHDGRARSLEEAILWHGGEAEAVKQSFVRLGQQQRADLIAFLNSL